MTVGELLRSQRRWGRARARKFLSSLALERESRAGTAHGAPARGAGRRARGQGTAAALGDGASAAPEGFGPTAPAQSQRPTQRTLKACPERRVKARVSPQAARAKAAIASGEREGEPDRAAGEKGERTPAPPPRARRRAPGCASGSPRSALESTARARRGRRARARPRSSPALAAPRTTNPTTSSTIATRTTSSTSGKEPQGARRSLVVSGCRAAPAWGRRRLRGQPAGPPASFAAAGARTALARWRLGAHLPVGGAGAPGLTDSPRRALRATSPAASPGCPSVAGNASAGSRARRRPRWTPGPTGSARARRSSPRPSRGSAPRPRPRRAELGLRLAEPGGERVAHPLQLGDPKHPRPADRADRPLHPLAREGGGEQLAEPLLQQMRSAGEGPRGRDAR